MRCQLSSYTANITYCSQWGTSGTRTGQLQYVILNEAAQPRADSCQYPGLITHVLNVYIPRITNGLWMGNNWDLFPAEPSLCEYHSRDRLCAGVSQVKSWHLICQTLKMSIYDLYTNKPRSLSLHWTGHWGVKRVWVAENVDILMKALLLECIWLFKGMNVPDIQLKQCRSEFYQNITSAKILYQLF